MTIYSKHQATIIGIFGHALGTKLFSWLDPCCPEFCEAVNACVATQFPILVASNVSLGNSTANSNVLTYTAPVTASYEVGGFLNLLTFSGTVGQNLTVVTSWTDEAGTSRTAIQLFSVSGGIVSTLNTPEYAAGVPFQIRAQAGTSISIAVVYTGTPTATYNVGASIVRIY